MTSATTPVEITVWFQVWMAYSPYGERYTATVDVDGRGYRAEMMRIYGKIDSSEVQGVDALFIACDATLPFAVADLGDPDVWAAASRAAALEFELIREPIRRLARRIVEYLRLERPDIDVGLSADRGSHQPLGREHQVEVRVANAATHGLTDPRLAIDPVWSWGQTEETFDASTLPLLEQTDFERAVAAAVRDPEYSRIQLRDARDHRRDGDLRIAVVLAVTACETRFKEVATARFQIGWNELLRQRAKPTFGQAREREQLVFGSRYGAENLAADNAMKKAMRLRNDLIHNALTTAEPTAADAAAAVAAADAYIAWLDAC